MSITAAEQATTVTADIADIPDEMPLAGIVEIVAGPQGQEAVFEFGDDVASRRPFRRGLHLVHSHVPLSIASQAKIVDHAVSVAALPESEPVDAVRLKASRLTDAALMATISSELVKIEETPAAAACDNAVVLAIERKLVIMPSVDAATGAVPADFTAHELRLDQSACRASQELPELKGSGAEVLSLFTPEERQIVIAALQKVQRGDTTEPELLTHDAVDRNDAREYFRREATAVLRRAGIHRGVRGHLRELAATARFQLSALAGAVAIFAALKTSRD